MTFDNFDATLLVADTPLLPIAAASEALEAKGPTLDDALREAEQDEAAPPDLWVNDAMHIAPKPAAVGEASGVAQITASATTPQEAGLMAQAYLNSIGLGGVVHVGSVTGSNEEIVITANTYHHPTAHMPVLSMDDSLFGSFDQGSIYDLLDVSAHTITIDTDEPLTPQQLAAVEELRLQIGRTTAMLNVLPANGVFTYPDGTTVTVADLRVLWARTDIVVTSHNYADLGIPSSPGMGAAIRNDGDPIFKVNVDALTTQFMANPWTATWWPLHELAHVTWVGDAKNAAIWADGVKTDSEHYMNEAFATSLAIAITEAAGYQWISGFLTAYQQSLQLVPRPTFSAEGGGTSGGGSGGNGGGGGGGGGTPYQ